MILRLALGFIGALLLLVDPAAAQAPVAPCVTITTAWPQPGGCQPVTSTNPLPSLLAPGGTLPNGAVVIGPSGSAGAGIAPIVSAAAESSHVLKATPGNLYSVYVASPSASGFLMTFNSATVPGDGAVTPIDCIPVSASSLGFVNYIPGPPGVFATGIAVAFSSTGCFTKTTSPTAFFHGVVQ